MINFHFKNNLYLGKPLSFKELERRRQKHIGKIITLWGYFSSMGNGTLYSLRREPLKVTLNSASKIANYVKHQPNKCFTRYIAFTTEERARTFIRSLDYMTDKQRLSRDLSEYYTEVYD